MISSLLSSTYSSRFSLAESKVPLALLITGLVIAIISALFLVSAFTSCLPIEHTFVSVEAASTAFVGGVALALVSLVVVCRKRCFSREVYRDPNFTFREINRPVQLANGAKPWPLLPDEIKVKILEQLHDVQDILNASLVNKSLYNLCAKRWEHLTKENGYIPLPKNPNPNWKMLFFKHGGYFAQQILRRKQEGKKAETLNSPRSSSYLALEVGERFEFETEHRFLVVKKWGCFEILNPKTKGVLRRFSYSDKVTCFKPEGKFLFCGHQNGRVEIFDCETAEVVRVVHEAGNKECCFLQLSDTRLVAAFKGGLIKIWDRTRFACTEIRPLNPEKEILELKMDGDTLMVHYSNKVIKVWNLATRTLICDALIESKFEIIALKFLKDKIVIQEKFNELIIWNYLTDKSFKIQTRNTFQDFCIFNRFIATINGESPTVRLYDSETGDLLERVPYRDVIRQPQQSTHQRKLAVQGLLNMIFVSSPVGGGFRSAIISNH